VESGLWYAQAVNYLTSQGILSGYPDGDFKPDAPITRAELTAIVERLDSDPKTGANPFADLDGSHWAVNAILSAASKGWIAGYPDGTFKPDASITRAEAIKVVNGFLDRRQFAAGFAQAHPSPYADLTPAHWAYADIIEASVAHSHAAADGLTQPDWLSRAARTVISNAEVNAYA
jgi:hypothetical protein